MNSRILDVYPRIPLFTTLLLFTITFFVYDDFGIRMIFGYAALMCVVFMYLIFRNNNIRITRLKAIYLVLSLNLSVLILVGKVNSSSTVFVMAIVLSAIVAAIGDIRRTEMKTAYRILAVFSVLIAFYVVAVRLYPPLYKDITRPLISDESKAINDLLIVQGYGVSLGGNIVFVDYVLTLCGLLTLNFIMTYKKTLRYKWLYWGCLAVCAGGMLFVNRKSELLSFIVAVIFCYRMHMGINTRGERKRAAKIAVVIIALAAAVMIILGLSGFLYRYLVFFQRLIQNMGDTETKVDVTSERSVLWALAFSLFKKHPILGIGWGHFHDYLPEAYNNLDNVHNNYLQLLCETGVVGFFMIMIPLFLIFKETIRSIRVNRRKTNREPMLMALNITSFGMQIFYLVLSFLDPCIYKMLFWALFAIAVMFADSTEGAMNETLQVT